MMTRTLCSLAVAGASLMGCHRARSRSAGESTGNGFDRQLALMPPGGSAPIDSMIAKLQGEATRNADDPEKWLALGRAWLRKARESAAPGLYASANACAAVVLAKDSTNRLALDLSSLVMLNDHRFDDARKLAEGLVAKEPRDAMAWGTLSDTLLELGRYDESSDAAQKMIDLKANLASYSRASYLMWLRGDGVGATQAIQLALDAGRDPQDPEPRAWVTVQAASLLWNQGDLDTAEAGFDKAIESLPDFPPALVGKARVAMARGRLAAAVDLLQRAWDRSPLVETAYLLGEAKEAMGDPDGAARAFDLVVRRGRESDRRTLAVYLADRGLRLDEAVRLAQMERSLRPDIYSDDAFAWALHKAGRSAEAWPVAEHAIRMGTPDPRLLYHAGAIALAAGEMRVGREKVALALKLNPAFDVFEAGEARALLTARPASHVEVAQARN